MSDIQIVATQNTTKSVSLFFRDSGTGAPVTGLTFGDFSPIYAVRGGASAFSVTLSGLIFSEIDAANMPGFYNFEMSSTLLSQLGEIVFFFPRVGGGPTEEVVLRVDVRPALVSADLSSVTSLLTDIQGAGFDTGTDSLAALEATLSSGLTSLEDLAERTLGLSQENMTITGQVYDVDGNLTQSTVTLYPSRDDLILTQNAIASYTMLATYNGDGQMLTYSVRKNP